VQLAAVQAALEGKITGTVRAGELMARHTTFRIGGPAALFVEADTVGDLKLTLEACGEYGVEWTAVGKGSNLLVSDGGYGGVVLVLGKDFKRHHVDGSRIESGAGVVLGHVVRDAYSLGLSGLEFAVGVPGTVGGAVAMNAGSRTDWIGSVVESVTVYESGNGLVRLSQSEIDWGYRRTDLTKRGVIVECVLRLQSGDKARIRRTMDMNLKNRKSSQPLSLPSAGSVFRNPEGSSAGQLIEEAGLKGTRVGGAQISEMHANFIVNRGGATAADVATLMAEAARAVRDRNGIELTPEIRFLGAFDAA